MVTGTALQVGLSQAKCAYGVQGLQGTGARTKKPQCLTEVTRLESRGEGFICDSAGFGSKSCSINKNADEVFRYSALLQLR